MSPFALLLAIGINCALHHYFPDWSRPARLHEQSLGSYLSHLALVHNVTPWFYSINPVFWTVATEWQIHFLFALILLYLTHYPLMDALTCFSRYVHFAPAIGFAVFSALGVCLSLTFAYAFHLAFERPFLASSERAAGPVDPVVSTSSGWGSSLRAVAM